MAGDRGEWGPQLVAHIGYEVVLCWLAISRSSTVLARSRVRLHFVEQPSEGSQPLTPTRPSMSRSRLDPAQPIKECSETVLSLLDHFYTTAPCINLSG